jgi:uncharacterized membrane protein YeaQ/YmgE (transglycosylase-associated protein family)
MELRPGKNDEDYARNAMWYHDEHKSDDDFFPAEIWFPAFIPPKTFRELAANTKSGLLPSQITVKFEGPSKTHPLEYRGTGGIIWHNKEHRSVAIESIGFHYVIEQGRPERALAWDEPRRDAAAQPPKQEKNVVANILFQFGIIMMGAEVAEYLFPQWYFKGQLSTGEAQILAVISFIGGAILVFS